MSTPSAVAEPRVAEAKITDTQIEEFVAAFYLALDQHVPAEAAACYVAQDVEMVFPEKALHGIGDFVAWYSGGTYSDGTPAPGVINIFFDENHWVASVKSQITGDQATVDIVVAWQASVFQPPSAKSKRVSLDATQRWTVRRTDKNQYGLEIVSYNAMAEPMRFTPGFARL